jgi:hypothetical protein
VKKCTLWEEGVILGCGQREPQPPDLCQKGADLLEEVAVATITYWEAIWSSSIEVHDI